MMKKFENFNSNGDYFLICHNNSDRHSILVFAENEQKALKGYFELLGLEDNYDDEYKEGFEVRKMDLIVI